MGFLYTSHLTRLLNHHKTITILAWPQEIDSSELAAFEQKTGINVRIRYIENNEELIIKLMASDNHGIDVVMPTDYAAQLMIKNDLLKKIDSTKLTFMHTINPCLTNHYFDPHNHYTIPYYWGIYGIGFDKDYFNTTPPPASWHILFDKQFKDARIAMPDNARYLVLITAHYLFGTIEHLTKQHLKHIKQALIAQKPLVELYTESRGEYLLASKASALVVLLSADIAKAMHAYPHVDFMIPTEGSFMLIDSFALTKQTEKEELVYEFFNYLYQPEVLQKYVDKFIFFPATTNVKPAFQPPQLQMPTETAFKKIDFYRNTIPKEALNDIWISLKS